MSVASALVNSDEIFGRCRPLIWSAVAPAALNVLALLGAGMLAYGTRASLAQYDGGLETIILVRRIQWLLVGVSLICSMILLTIVIANRAPAWWLAGLACVLALFAMRFAPEPGRLLIELDVSDFADASHPAAPREDEWVVGLIFEGDAYAFPYRALHVTPLVTVTDYSKRMLLMWSSHANRAVAVHTTRDLRPRALEVVSTPGDGLLMLDRRYGQFISSVTGRLLRDGREPIGFSSPIAVTKTNWSNWRAAHPQTRVLLIDSDAVRQAPATPLAPRAVLPPRARAHAPAELGIILVATQPPVAVPQAMVSHEPVNLAGGSVRVLLVRDGSSGRLRAFERRAADDLFPIFSLRADRVVHPEAKLIDSDSHSLWTLEGRAVAGPLAGEQLRRIPVEEDLYWGVMKFWYPALQLVR